MSEERLETLFPGGRIQNNDLCSNNRSPHIEKDLLVHLIGARLIEKNGKLSPTILLHSCSTHHQQQNPTKAVHTCNILRSDTHPYPDLGNRCRYCTASFATPPPLTNPTFHSQISNPISTFKSSWPPKQPSHPKQRVLSHLTSSHSGHQSQKPKSKLESTPVSGSSGAQ